MYILFIAMTKKTSILAVSRKYIHFLFLVYVQGYMYFLKSLLDTVRMINGTKRICNRSYKQMCKPMYKSICINQYV